MSDRAEPIEYDYIIIGGGTAGCVVAARLIEAFPNSSILIVESGKGLEGNVAVKRPLESMFSSLMDKQKAATYISEMDRSLNGRQLPVAAGNMLGGGSGVSFMIYGQAPASDWDDWNQPGWSYKEMQPFIHKAITFLARCGDPAEHGTQGPMVVTRGGHKLPDWMWNFNLVALKARDMRNIRDMSDQVTADGYGILAKWIDTKGRRSTTVSSYLVNAIKASHQANTCTMNSTIVDSILIKEGKAVGIKLAKGAEAMAKKQIILCAGALGSPLILQRSGIGSKDSLSEAGVQTKVDLPGVGREYRDKQLASYYVDDACETLDAFLNKDEATVKAQLKLFNRDGTGQAATNGINLGFKFRPTEEEIAALGPEFTEHWSSISEGKPDKPVVTGALCCQYIGDRSNLPPGKYMTFGWWQNYPASRGSIRIATKYAMDTSSPYTDDWSEPVKFKAGLLRHPADLPVLIWVYKVTREMARRMSAYRGEYADSHPSFHDNSAAACKRHDGPITDDSKIIYSAEDDEEIEHWIRDTVISAWNSSSTCPMRAREDFGVVDSKLNVYGVEGLKIADTSIVPQPMGTTMMSVALAIGEKCASIVIDELRNA